LTSRRTLIAAALAVIITAILLLMLIAFQSSPVYDHLIAWIYKEQSSYTRRLAAAVRILRDTASEEAFFTLMGIGFAYGIFHAVGPGHGKAVITTYALTHETSGTRTAGLASASALVQGFTAIAIVGGLHLLLQGSLRRSALAVDDIMDPISFAAVSAVGLYFTFRGSRALYRSIKNPNGKHGTLINTMEHSQDGAHNHGCHHHLVTPQQAEQASTWSRAAMVTIAVGVRPCSGAIVVLILSFALGLIWSGIAAVLAMSMGTAITVSALALGAQSIRIPLMRLIGAGGFSASTFTASFALLGGVAIAFIGASLLYGSLITPAHPFR
tara:strand:- start:479 stop:1456 length:978 start_codon:yes stop_codon:yes gene_type:complete